MVSPFRDGSAARDRAMNLAEENERLQAENDALRLEIERLGSAREATQPVRDLRAALRERDALRASMDARSTSHMAAITRLRAESKELTQELHRRIAELEAQLAGKIDERSAGEISRLIAERTKLEQDVASLRERLAIAKRAARRRGVSLDWWLARLIGALVPARRRKLTPPKS